MNETEHRRRERSLFAVLLLFGIGILLYIGELAIGIAPNWEVAANMRSNLDPNSDFLTLKNSGIVEPLNSDILTLPAWLYLFTPNATMPTNAGITPPPTRASTRVPTRPATLQPTIVGTFPVTPPTKKPPLPASTSTPTNIPSLPSANLAITKTDGNTTYIPGSGISYQIVVTNGGPNNASGFSTTDTVPAVINITSVNCAPSGTASCGTNGSAGNNVSFTGISVNAGAGNRITITINGTVNAGATGNLVNTASIVIPGGAGFSDPNTSNNTATDTDTPIFEADLSVTKSDGATTYIAGGTTIYTVTVLNNSATTGVMGALVNDVIPPQVASWTWTCSEFGGASGCSPAAPTNASFNDTVNLPPSSSITYTVTTTISGTASGDLMNIATVGVPTGYIDSDPGNNESLPDIDSPAVDLQITKTDGGGTYAPGDTLTYTIVVTNSSTFTVTGATVTDTFPAQILSANWTCAGTGGATCTSGSGNILNDTVNLPAATPSSSVIYTVTANVSASAVGTLTNTASVTTPAGFTDTDLSNNSAPDSDTCTTLSEINIGPPDNSALNIPPLGSLTILFSPAIVANGDVGTPDLVYYESEFAPTPGEVQMDWVKVEISSDGSTWHQVLYWGDPPPPGTSDTNTNLALSLVGDLCEIAGVPTETDNCAIPTGRLYPSTGISTGITIDIDPISGIVAGNSYPWMRITSPLDGAEGTEIDAIQPYYP